MQTNSQRCKVHAGGGFVKCQVGVYLGLSDATCVSNPYRGGLSGLSGPSDATCGRRTQPPEGRDQPNVIPSLDQMQCNVM